MASCGWPRLPAPHSLSHTHTHTHTQARLSQSGREHEVEVLRLQSRNGALEASLEGSRLREASLERDISVMQVGREGAGAVASACARARRGAIERGVLGRVCVCVCVWEGGQREQAR